MPTLILVDTSLSMGRLVGPTESGRSLAAVTLEAFAAAVRSAGRDRLEWGALAALSHSVTPVQSWTRDWEAIGSSGSALEAGTKRGLATALAWAREEAGRVWAAGSRLRILLLTDGKRLSGGERPAIEAVFPFPLPLRLDLIVLAEAESLPVANKSELAWLVETANSGSAEALGQPPASGLHILSHPTPEALIRLAAQLVEEGYATMLSELRLGSLSAKCALYPPPLKAVQEQDFSSQVRKVSNRVEVIGFLRPNEFGSPAVLSRHLLLPAEGDEKDANLCVLLHGGLKTESAVAIVRVAPEWYGYLHHLDAKKSNLILHLLRPGSSCAPWLGKLHLLSIRDWLGEDKQLPSPLPVPIRPKPSYALTPLTSWTHRPNLSSDLSKVTKYAKKLPERKSQFYSELNRLVRHSLSLGFVELLHRLCALLEEIRVTQAAASPDLARHLLHAVSLLRDPLKLPYDLPVPPL